MKFDIINVRAVQEKVDELLDHAPPALRDKSPVLRAWLIEAIKQDGSVRRAHVRKNDPAWAKDKFERGKILHRFYPNKLDDWDITATFEVLAQLAEITLGTGPIANEGRAFFRGLPHRQLSLEKAGDQARDLIDRAELAAIWARRDEVLNCQMPIRLGAVTGQACRSIKETIKLGREAKNCLTKQSDYWKSLVDRKIDIWAVRNGSRLIAVLEVKRDQNKVVEAYGPTNTTIGLSDVGDVAQFCAEAGLVIGHRCEGLLPDYAASQIVAPRLVEVGNEVAWYAEWPTAVRIDLSGRNARGFEMFKKTAETLSLSFDPEKLCGDEAFGDNSLQQAVISFGRKEVRKIVRTIALTEKTPTLVQHRLLTLAA